MRTFRIMSANCIALSMALSKLQGPGLIDYPNVFFIWGFSGKIDSSLFILRKGQSIVFLLIYVDDIIVTSNDNNIISCGPSPGPPIDTTCN